MNKLKNLNPSHMDMPVIFDRSFDKDTDSLRVSVIDGITMNVDKINFPEMKLPEQSIKEIKVPEIIREVHIERIEVPVIVKQVEFKEIMIPVVVPEVRIIEIEKPIVIKETEVRIVKETISTFPKLALACMIIQALASIGFLIAIIKR